MLSNSILFISFLLISATYSQDQQNCPIQNIMLPRCSIFFRNCSQGFQFLNCTEQQCIRYGLTPRTSVGRCIKRISKLNSQVQCAADCCNDHPQGPLTGAGLAQCIQRAKFKPYTGSTVGLVLGITFGLMLATIFAALLVYACTKIRKLTKQAHINSENEKLDQRNRLTKSKQNQKKMLFTKKYGQIKLNNKNNKFTKRTSIV